MQWGRSSTKKLLWLWTNFTNSFMWSTGIKTQIFWTYDFLVPVIFWSISNISWIKKWARSKKIVIIKNQFFHARQRNFWNLFTSGLFLMTFFPELLMAATIPGIEFFSWKSAWIVFLNMQNANFRGASESERTKCVLMMV